MTKGDLKTGMFGKDCDDDLFVIVDDHFVFRNGLYTTMESLNENFTWKSGRGRIKAIYKTTCFKEIDRGNAEVLWSADEPTTEMTIAELERKLGIKNLKIIKEEE